MVDPVIWDIGYLLSSMFIVGIKRLSSPRTVPSGNRLGAKVLLALVTLMKLQLRE